MIDSYNYNSIGDNILFNGGRKNFFKSGKKEFMRVGNEIYNDTAKLSKQAKSKRDNVKKAFIEDAKNIKDSFTSLSSSDIVNANIALIDTLYDMSNNEDIKEFIIKNNGNIDNNLYKNLLTQIYEYKNKSLSFIKIIFYSKFNWVLKQYLLNVNNDKNIQSLINKLINKEELIKQINYLYNRKISKQDEVNILNNLQKLLCIINILISAKFTVKKKKLTMSKNPENIYEIISGKFKNNNIDNIRLNINHINIFEDNIQLISDILKQELPNIFDSNTYNIDNNKIHIFANRFFNVKQDSKLKAIINELKTTVKSDNIKKLTEIVTIDNNIFNYKLDLYNYKIEPFRESDSNRQQLEQPIKFIKFTMIGIYENLDLHLNNVQQKIFEYFKALNIKNLNKEDFISNNYNDNNVLKHLVLNKILIFLIIILFVSHYDNYDDFYKNLLNYTNNQNKTGGTLYTHGVEMLNNLFRILINCISLQTQTTGEENEQEILETKIEKIIEITTDDNTKVSLPNNSELRSNSLSSKTENLINEYLKIQFINIINNPAYLGILQTDDNDNDKEYKINMKDIQELYKDFHIGNDKNISQDALLKNFTLGLDSNKLKKIDNMIDEKLTDNYLNFSIFKGIFDIPKERMHKTDKMVEGFENPNVSSSELQTKYDEKQEKQQEDISKIFDKDIILIFNKLSEISNKSLKLNINDDIASITDKETYNVDTFESIDSLFRNIYNRLNYSNSKKIYFEINDNLYNITTTPIKFIEPFILNDIKIKIFSKPTPSDDIIIPNIQIDDNLYNITTTPIKFIEPFILNDIKIKIFSKPTPSDDIIIPNIQIDDNLYNITTTPIKFIEPFILNDIKIKTYNIVLPIESQNAKVEIKEMLTDQNKMLTSENVIQSTIDKLNLTDLTELKKFLKENTDPLENTEAHKKIKKIKEIIRTKVDEKVLSLENYNSQQTWLSAQENKENNDDGLYI